VKNNIVKFNGERLKKARLYRGFTISELAEKINVSKQAISQYENGKASPENEKMFLIMNELGFPYDYFFGSYNVEVSVGSTYFRSQLTTNKKARLAHMVKSEHLAIIYRVVNKYVDFPKLNIPMFDLSIKNIEEISREVRNFFNLDIGPIDDMIYILEKNGVTVTSCEVDANEIDAYTQYIKIGSDDKYIVTLSCNKKSAVRTQFDAAHELGHIVLHSWSEDIEALSKEEFRQREDQSNKFAAAFLLPKETFIKDLSIYSNSLDHYVRLKKKWKVSIAAMIVRAYQLKVLSYNQYQYLMRQVSKKGWKTREPYDDIIVLNKPMLLKKSVDLLLDNEIFTEEGFIKELEINGLPMNYMEVEFLLDLERDKLKPKKNKNVTELLKLKF
jgi:Zn-dependent peptidase ImmA (M78 family)/DNA-binding XRE family transcriptional regulator